MAINAPALEVQGVSVQVQARLLLEEVSLRAGRGEFIGLVGPNGAGKTTLLRTILGILRAQKGAIVLDGQALSSLSPREVARRVGYLPQGIPDTFSFTALEVVLMGRYPHLGPFQVEGERDRQIALEAMRQTETEAFAQRAVTTLSGGERQRVFLARALAQQAPLLLLDEPIANLDIQHQVKVMGMVRAMAEHGLTAIAAVHNLELAAAYCHRLVVLQRGRVVADGCPQHILTPDLLQRVFGVTALIYQDPATQRLVVTPTDTMRPRAEKGLRVHVVCGGGSGAHLLYLLWREGYMVTVCPLGEGDTDRVVASALGIPFIPIPAFSPVDDQAHERHEELVAQADVAVLCSVPFGPNNLRNLQALGGARRFISIEDGLFATRDFTGGVAERVFQSLTPTARCRSPRDVLTFLQQWEGAPAPVGNAGGAC
ncbi:MAG: ABC transporter ATP-binding protein [Dehalococcoidia bacterium]|nr:ABC transporter ATP-binding protein [Dehalococcoidia bacterium]MDW8119155.1 ABC transporter ATP-binding protein [Chloroflexota bacterium]